MNRCRSHSLGLPWPVRLCSVLTVATSLVTGCAQISQMENKLGLGGGGELTVDPNDACRTERQEFGASKSYFTDQIIGSTLVGAAGGAAIGALTAVATGGKAGTGALIGAGAGALTGLAAGYYQTMSEKYQDQNELARKINADLSTEGQQIDHTLASFARLRQCRFMQAALIKSQLRHGQIDRTTAQSQLAYQRARFDEEVALAKSYGATMAKRDDEFQSATNQLSQNRPPRKAKSDPGNQAVAAATETIPEKRSNFDQVVDKAATASTVAFNIDTDTKTS